MQLNASDGCAAKSCAVLPAVPTVAAPLADDALALHNALSHLVRIYQYRDRDRICCHDISVTQCHALEALVEQGALRSQALAAQLRLDKSTTTRVVDALVRKAYAIRDADPEDARAVLLTVTAAGRKLYTRIRDDLVAQQADLLADLDPQVRSAAITLIRRLAQAAQQRFQSGVATDCCPLPGST